MILEIVNEVIDEITSRIGRGPVFPIPEEPVYLRNDHKVRYRRYAAIWFINGNNTGFHVDEYGLRIELEAWGKRKHVSMQLKTEDLTSKLILQILDLVFPNDRS